MPKMLQTVIILNIHSKSVGPGTALAICASIAVVDLLYPSLVDTATKALEQTTGEAGRFECKNVVGTSFINDAYNSNPQSLRAGLKTLAEHFKDKEKIIVLGTMLELGEDSLLMHSELGKDLQNVPNIKCVVTVGEFAEKFGQGNHEHFENLDAFLESTTWNSWIQNKSITSDGVVYLKASNTIRLHQIPHYWEQAMKTRDNNA